MELESVSKISKEDYCRFFRFVNFKTGWKKLLIPVEFVLIVVLTIMILISALYSYSSDIFLLISIEVMVVFLWLYIWLMAPRVAYKLSAKLYSIDNYFVWYKDHFTVKVNTDGMVANTDTKYINLVKVCEVGEYLYLFVTNNQAHIIPKSSFTKGSWKELSSILKDNLGNRYKTDR